MTLVPRYYQKDAIGQCFDHLNKKANNPCIVLPTGSGKSLVISEICKKVVGWGGRVLVISHVKELLVQLHDHITAADPDLIVGIYSAGLKSRETETDVVIGGVQSIVKRGFELCGDMPFALVLIDEAHRIPLSGEGQYQTLLKDLTTANPLVRVVGLTATPFRTGQGYVCRDDHFINEICYEINPIELVEEGFLSPLISKRGIADVDMKGVTKSAGDFNSVEMEERFLEDEKVKLAVQEIVDLTKDRKKVLIFCCGIEHAKQVANELEEIHGEKIAIVTSFHQGRDESIVAFRDGDAKFLVNVNVLTTGFDAPNIDCVALLRATASPGMYVQMLGRGMRLCEGKEDCLCLDFGGNVTRLGTLGHLKIDDEGKSDEKAESPVRECPECHEYVNINEDHCDGCGYVFPPPEEIKPSHGHTASNANPMGDGSSIEYMDVVGISYVAYTSKANLGNPDAKQTLRATYQCKSRDDAGFNNRADFIWVNEYVCVEHSGYANEKAFDWWCKRTDANMPNTAQEAEDHIRQFGIIKATQIRVMWKADSDWPSILGHTLEDEIEPPTGYGASRVGDDDYDEDDIPF